MSVIDIEKLPEFDGHEMVLRISDATTGLRGFIAIHRTFNGKALGGTRYWHYKNEEEALHDALRLSRAMSYKCALANLDYGGGKAVLMTPNRVAPHKNQAYLAAYAKRLKAIGECFFTGEDVGMEERDIKMLAQMADNIIGRPSVGGLPSPWAAESVYQAMRAALKATFGKDSFKGRTVAIKGLGNVGFDLARRLSRAGAHIIAAETNTARAARAKKAIPNLHLVSPAVIHKQEADIFSPCALSGDLSRETIPQLKANIVCGSANNQLKTPEDGMRLFKRGIVYVPDYVANAGGLITVADELHRGGYSKKRVAAHVAHVYDTVHDILKKSKAKRRPPETIADEIAEKRFRLQKTS